MVVVKVLLFVLCMPFQIKQCLLYTVTTLTSNYNGMLQLWHILVPFHLVWNQHRYQGTLRQKATIHQVTTMLATSKTAIFPGHNHLRTTSTDDLTLWLLPERQQGISTGG